MSASEVTIEKVEPATIASIREVVPGYEAIPAHIGEIVVYLEKNKVAPAGPPFVMYWDEAHKEKDADIETAFPIAGPIPSGDRVKVRAFPGTGQAASLTLEGSYEGLRDAYRQLLGWIRANGYRIVGPPREVYLEGGPDCEPSEYLTKIQFPVVKR